MGQMKAVAMRLDEIRDRCEAASPGPWHMDGVRVIASDATRGEGGLVTANAQFVAAARDDVPWLLALVESQSRELAELRGLLADLCEDSRAAARAVRYRRALQEIADCVTADPVTGRLSQMLIGEAMLIARESLDGRQP